MALPFSRLYGPGTPLVIPSPAGLALVSATTGGTIAASTTVAYRVSAVYNSVETLPCAEVAVTTGSGTSTNSVTISWTPVLGATSYKVYGRTTGAELLIATVTASTYIDTGSVTPSGAMPGSTIYAEATGTPGLYVSPTGTTTLIKQIKVSNPTTVTGQLYLAIVPAAGLGAGGIAAQRIDSGVPIPPDSSSATGQPYSEPCFHVLAAGDYLTGYVTAPGLVLTIDGMAR